MCGGVRFKYDEKLEPVLAEMYSTEQIDLARTSGTVQSVFWQPRPVLPAIVDGELRLFDWGNRDQALKLPKTGWVRMESLDAGKWNYLKPTAVVIPAFQGVEKKVWFGIDHGIQGFLSRSERFGSRRGIFDLLHQLRIGQSLVVGLENGTLQIDGIFADGPEADHPGRSDQRTHDQVFAPAFIAQQIPVWREDTAFGETPFGFQFQP